MQWVTEFISVDVCLLSTNHSFRAPASSSRRPMARKWYMHYTVAPPAVKGQTLGLGKGRSEGRREAIGKASELNREERAGLHQV